MAYNLKNAPTELHRQWAKEGAAVSTITRREKAIGRYLKIVQEKGIEEALRVCRRESWKTGYNCGRLSLKESTTSKTNV